MNSPVVPFDKLPPQNLQAELGVLGSILLDNASFHDVADLLDPEDFYRDTHQILYRAMKGLHAEGRPVDAITLVDELDRLGLFARAGGDEAIRRALEDTPSAANSLYYAQIVKQRSIARGVIEAAHDTLRDAYSDNFTADELLDGFQRRALAISDGQPGREPVPASAFVDESLARFEGHAADEAGGGLMVGFVDLDMMLGGLRPKMYLLGARPSQGKTAFGLNVARHVAEHEAQPVLFFSIEMGVSELSDRLLSGRSGVDGNKVRMPRYARDDDRARFRDAARIAREFPLWVDDSATITSTRMASVARRFKARHGLGLIVVDYVQIMSAENAREPRQEQVATFSRRLNAMAKELDVPVLALAQLNREVEKREDKRPRLSDLRESGQLEADAYGVLLLHRPEFYDENDRPGVAEVIVAKNRGGATGTVTLAFEKSLTRFSDLEDRNRGGIGPDHPF